MRRCWQSSSGTGGWTPSPWFLAQINHAEAGLLIFPLVYVAHWPAWLPIGLLLLWAAVKEFWLDIFVLEGDSWAGSTEDFLAYFIGTSACGLALVHFWLGAAVFAMLLLSLTIFDILHPDDSP